MTTSLAESAWPGVPDRPVVLVPIGSTEQHGPHLPMATDALIANAVALAVARRLNAVASCAVLVAPALPYGASGEHQAFPGTVSIGHDALRCVLVELVRSLSVWAGRVIFVNGHGGNASTLRGVIDQMRFEQQSVSSVTCAFESASDAHAGHDETSVMLHLHPELVAMSRAEAGNPAPLSELLPELMAWGVRPIAENGILGDPTKATADAGRVMFDGLVDRIATEVSNG